jgi:hypothetical protein
MQQRKSVGLAVVEEVHLSPHIYTLCVCVCAREVTKTGVMRASQCKAEFHTPSSGCELPIEGPLFLLTLQLHVARLRTATHLSSCPLLLFTVCH